MPGRTAGRLDAALRRPIGFAAAAGTVLGGALVALALFGVAAGDGASARGHDVGAWAAPRLDAAHLPPLLTVPGEPIELRYDIYCPPPPTATTDACDGAGEVFVRPGTTGPYRSLPLRLEPSALEGRYVVRVPADVAGSPAGFTYYAVLRDRSTGASLTLPGGGGAAPLRSLPLGEAVDVDLGSHAFGRVRAPTDRAFGAIWGDGEHAGLEGGPETQPIGPSSFDVAADGSVAVLDQVHRRLLRVDNRGARLPALPLPVNGTIADLAVEPDGALWVLETAGVGAPLLRGFTRAGHESGRVPLADRTAAQLRLSALGPVVKQYPSEQWLPAVSGAGRALAAAAQRAAGEVTPRGVDGRGVTVLRTDAELRVALSGRAGLERAWRIRSDTSLAEVQLAEPHGEGVLLVVRAYRDGRDEFLVLRLGRAGLLERFALESADWAETAPLSRFRLRGSSLYQLGSTPAGVHVDRFDLEVT